MEMARESRVRMSIFWHWTSDIRLRIFVDLKVHAIISFRSILRDQWLSHLHLDLNWMSILCMRSGLKTSWVLRVNLSKLIMRVKWWSFFQVFSSKRHCINILANNFVDIWSNLLSSNIWSEWNVTWLSSCKSLVLSFIVLNQRSWLEFELDGSC